MEHSALRLLATTLLPGVLVFVLLFTIHTPVLHTQSYWNNPQPALVNDDNHQLLRIRELSTSRFEKRSDSPSNLIGVRDAEDPGACLKDAACRGYLNSRARESYGQCMARVQKYGHSKVAKNNGCRFIDGKRRGSVALTSFPGSGNTWVRTLLEKATGVCTGSFACDMSLRYAGFTGEGIQSPNVIVIKTHQAVPNWGDERSSSKFSSAILLVRNPLDALVADWNRYVANGFQFRTVHLGTHTQKAGRDYFRNNSGWNSFVMRRSHLWIAMIENWLINSAKSHKHKVLIVVYEDLKANRDVELDRMLKFLKVDSIPDVNVADRSDSSPEVTETKPLQNFTANFYRKHSSNEEPFDPYTTAQRAHVVDIMSQVQDKLVKHGLTSVLDVSRYLEKENKKKLLTEVVQEEGVRT